ncbi:hypothetical protein DFH08DRAFT_814956 [Mycena albidolilacea]|uniref:Uncharacterized protein n=1 Tax=Mycena albidolilacea TaxID=1033008 RepID=A0AAD6ZNG5_9AGAR|nr:hypothetical protein DFH08DRAFT_814956 [Mycena albidolilacea]
MRQIRPFLVTLLGLLNFAAALAIEERATPGSFSLPARANSVACEAFGYSRISTIASIFNWGNVKNRNNNDYWMINRRAYATRDLTSWSQKAPFWPSGPVRVRFRFGIGSEPNSGNTTASRATKDMKRENDPPLAVY